MAWPPQGRGGRVGLEVEGGGTGDAQPLLGGQDRGVMRASFRIIDWSYGTAYRSFSRGQEYVTPHGRASRLFRRRRSGGDRSGFRETPGAGGVAAMSETRRELVMRKRGWRARVRVPRAAGETLRALRACLWPIEWPTAIAAALAAVLPGLALRFHGPLTWLAGTLLVVVAVEHAGAAIRLVPVRLAVVGLALSAVYAGNALLGASYFIQRRGFNDNFFAHLNRNTAQAIPIFGTEVALVIAYSAVGLPVALLAGGVWRLAVSRGRWAP
jgi:hypothetical protein